MISAPTNMSNGSSTMNDEPIVGYVDPGTERLPRYRRTTAPACAGTMLEMPLPAISAAQMLRHGKRSRGYAARRPLYQATVRTDRYAPWQASASSSGTQWI